MPTRLLPSTSTPESTDRLLADVLDGPVEPTTRRLLVTASGGDPRLLRALVLTGLSLGDLGRVDGRWRWSDAGSRPGRLAALIEDGVAGFDAAQRAALRTLTRSWARPHTLSTVADEGGADAGDRPGLTHREQQILELLAAGLTAVAIAHRLDLSPRTVAKHQERMYRKFGTSDRLTTVLRAQRVGLLPVVRAVRVTVG
ncbi:LuxR C-terminal-related transcriptional regulator [Micromonospora sp. WMMD882]|uniref:helix-turn-helix transcriptional regulator n=1 Tax=Micromonospora sp. WMMD882 TaxID=3015151 RepID=UPI00248B73B8|nr:LuxR C-terminal-related transcriptional regulator [Micromonospora sp. WMMD882]WBB80609.1 LuxR C-terminal-related transcriptional regulator [Micromonospora sp. WMMD882]